MSLLWRLLTHRSRNQTDDLPDDLGTELEFDSSLPADEIVAEEEIVTAPILHLTDADFAKAAKDLNVSEATIRAVAEVEAAGRGFLPDGRPQILYEAHIFHRQTNGAHANAIDRNGVRLSSPSWDRTLYGRTGAWQHDRLGDAAKLNWDAAHRSASWGLFQILGTNHVAVGHPLIAGFVDAMNAGAGPHLDAFIAFIRTNRLDGHLRNRNWAAFARGYNGPGFAANQYDTKLAAAYAKWSRTT